MTTAIYTTAFLAALFISFLATGFIKNLATRLKIIAIPRKRDIHQKPTPRLGGLAISITFIVILVVAYLLYPSALNFTNETRFGLDRHLLGIVIGSIIITLVGVWDDIFDLKPVKQLFWQFVAAIAVVAAGMGINFIRSPWGPLPLDQWTFNLFSLGQYTYTITFWSDLFTIVWLILIINVTNWLDGLDGLAAGVSGIAALTLFILSLLVGNNIATATLAIILAGSIFGFLPWNWNPAKIFMGSAGSYLLGYILGVIAIISGGKMATAIIVLGLPVFDAFWVASRRIISGKSPFLADRRHLHHRLIGAGLSVKKSVAILYAVAIVFGILALLDANASAKLVLIIWTVAVLVILGTMTMALEKKNGKHIIENRK